MSGNSTYRNFNSSTWLVGDFYLFSAEKVKNIIHRLRLIKTTFELQLAVLAMGACKFERISDTIPALWKVAIDFDEPQFARLRTPVSGFSPTKLALKVLNTSIEHALSKADIALIRKEYKPAAKPARKLTALSGGGEGEGEINVYDSEIFLKPAEIEPARKLLGLLQRFLTPFSKPLPWQMRAVVLIYEQIIAQPVVPRGFILGDEQGAGKTLTAYWTALIHLMHHKLLRPGASLEQDYTDSDRLRAHRVFIVATRATLAAWQTDVAKLTGLPDGFVAFINSETRPALALTLMRSARIVVTTISYLETQTRNADKPTALGLPGPGNLIIIDEADAVVQETLPRVSQEGTYEFKKKSFAALLRFAAKCPRRLLMTGTAPYGNKPLNKFAAQVLLAGFGGRSDGELISELASVLRSHVSEQPILYGALKGMLRRRTAQIRQACGIPEIRTHEIVLPIGFTPEEHELLKQEEQSASAELAATNDTDLGATFLRIFGHLAQMFPNPVIGRKVLDLRARLRALELANLVKEGQDQDQNQNQDDDDDIQLPTLKEALPTIFEEHPELSTIERSVKAALRRLCFEHRENVIIFTDYVWHSERLAHILRDNVRVFLLHAGLDLNERLALVDALNSCTEPRVLITNLRIGDRGLSFGVCNHVIFVSTPFNPARLMQAAARANRLTSQRRDIYFYRFGADGSLVSYINSEIVVPKLQDTHDHFEQTPESKRIKDALASFSKEKKASAARKFGDACVRFADKRKPVPRPDLDGLRALLPTHPAEETNVANRMNELHEEMVKTLQGPVMIPFEDESQAQAAEAEEKHGKARVDMSAGLDLINLSTRGKQRRFEAGSKAKRARADLDLDLDEEQDSNSEETDRIRSSSEYDVIELDSD